jgi:CDP-glucose 4,6-dehydratase
MSSEVEIGQPSGCCPMLSTPGSRALTLDIRRPESVRPWQHVLEPLLSYLVLAEQTWHNPALAGAYNFGPLCHEAAPVRRVIDLAQRHWPGAQVRFASQVDGPHEAGLLTLDTARARAVLGLVPRWNLSQAVERTVTWYHRYGQGEDAATLCQLDMLAFRTPAAEVLP